MKKTFITLLALTGAASAATLTELATMDELAALSGDTGTSVKSVVTLNDVTTYEFTGAGSILKIDDEDIMSYITGGTGYLTIAAWIKPDSTSVNSIFSVGGQNDGFKFALYNGGLQATTKGVLDTNVGTSSLGYDSIPTDSWTLVALTINLSESGDSRFYMGTVDGKFATRQLGGWNDLTADGSYMAIGSGNTADVRDGYEGMIAGLTLFSSDGLVNNSDIAAKMSAAPVLVPEPTTATLSLLALAGLAARRRRR